MAEQLVMLSVFNLCQLFVRFTAAKIQAKPLILFSLSNLYQVMSYTKNSRPFIGLKYFRNNTAISFLLSYIAYKAFKPF